MTKAWQHATKLGDLHQVRLLLEHGADINARDEHNQTALMNATLAGNLELVRLLVERGADLNVTAKYNLSALMLAVIRGQVEIATLLIGMGADPNMRSSKDFGCRTALTLAEERKQDGIVDLLKQAGGIE